MNFRFSLSVAQTSNSIAERHFRTKLKRNQLPQLKFHKTMQTPHFCDFRQKKRVNNLQKKASIYQYYD